MTQDVDAFILNQVLHSIVFKWFGTLYSVLLTPRCASASMDVLLHVLSSLLQSSHIEFLRHCHRLLTSDCQMVCFIFEIQSHRRRGRQSRWSTEVTSLGSSSAKPDIVLSSSLTRTPQVSLILHLGGEWQEFVLWVTASAVLWGHIVHYSSLVS